MRIWDNGASIWTTTFADGDPIDTGTVNHASSPQLAIDSSNRVYVTYYQSDGSNYRIYLSRYDSTDVRIWDDDPAGWTTTFANGAPMDTGTGNCAGQQLAVDSNGRVYVTYHHELVDSVYLNRYDGTDVRIWDNTTTSWTTDFADGDSIDLAGGGQAASCQLAIDSSDRVYVTYRQSDGSTNHIYLSRYAATTPATAGSSSNTGSSSSSSGSSGNRFKIEGCFIATACYGTPMAEDVITLRKFRDEYLLTNATGRLFVKTYYKTSPPVADFIAKHPIIKSAVRTCLKPLVWIATSP